MSEIEGWGVKRPGDRVYHHFRGGFSLCQRIGFYPMDADHITEDGGSLEPNSDDCKVCFRKSRKAP